MIGEMIVNVRLRDQAEAAQRQRAVELEELNLELERRNADLQKLAYITSHDLQEPLRTIASFSDLLARKYQGRLDASADEYIRFLTDAAKRLHQQINDLLQYTRMESQDRPHVDCDLNEVADVAIANQADTARALGATIDCRSLPQVTADPLQLIQLLQHLVANALRFHGNEAPRVIISAQRAGDEWLVVVADNGIGVPPEHADRIFEMFKRLRPEIAGTGMGLAVCRRIIERHRGRIWVEPNVPRGSRFCFSLPARLDRDNPQRAA
jgi:light-regulated signal transduction histidine kinase (bacteriophytochrome)